MITPLDIQNKVFRKEFRGYNCQEVDEFLNLVIDGYETLYREQIESRDKISTMQEVVSNYKALEDTLKNTLVVAQSTGDSVRASARAAAEGIVSEARQSASKLINDGHDEVKKISYKYDEIKRSIDVYRARMSALINSQLDLLGDISAADKTLADIVGVKEVLAEIENRSRELAQAQNDEQSDNQEVEVIDSPTEESPDLSEQETVEETV